MADTREADRPGVTAAEAARELFARLPVPGKDIVWLADELIGIVQHFGSVALFRLPDADAHTLVCRAGSEQPFSPGRGALRLFRPLLARIAVVASDETGTEFRPYGGRYTLTRSSRTGPVRLEIEFTNTPAIQQLTITRVPASVAPRTATADAGVLPLPTA